MSNEQGSVEAAIAAEEAALLRSIEQEPPYLSQLIGIFSGRTGWVSMMMMAAQLVLFGAGVWAAIGFFYAADALTAVKWGIPAAVLLIMSLMIKLALWPVIHVNRMLAQLHRLELSVCAGHTIREAGQSPRLTGALSAPMALFGRNESLANWTLENHLLKNASLRMGATPNEASRFREARDHPDRRSVATIAA